MSSKRTVLIGLASLAALIGTPTLYAHGDEHLDMQKSPNGGQVRMAGEYHFELVVAKNSTEVKENPLLVYVTDHAGAKVPTSGGTGTVTLLAGKLKATSTLTPDGDNRLKGFAKYASDPGMKAVVQITLAGKAPQQARFTPLMKAGSKAPSNGGETNHKH